MTRDLHLKITITDSGYFSCGARCPIQIIICPQVDRGSNESSLSWFEVDLIYHTILSVVYQYESQGEDINCDTRSITLTNL